MRKINGIRTSHMSNGAHFIFVGTTPEPSENYGT